MADLFPFRTKNPNSQFRVKNVLMILWFQMIQNWLMKTFHQYRLGKKQFFKDLLRILWVWIIVHNEQNLPKPISRKTCLAKTSIAKQIKFTINLHCWGWCPNKLLLCKEICQAVFSAYEIEPILWRRAVLWRRDLCFFSRFYNLRRIALAQTLNTAQSFLFNHDSHYLCKVILLLKNLGRMLRNRSAHKL